MKPKNTRHPLPKHPVVPELMTEREAAEYLRLAPKTVWKMRKRGLIRGVQITNKSVRYSKTDLDAYIKSRTFKEKPVVERTGQ